MGLPIYLELYDVRAKKNIGYLDEAIYAAVPNDGEYLSISADLCELCVDSDFVAHNASVRLSLKSDYGLDVSRIENFEPYFLFGDVSGIARSGPVFRSGYYELQSILYSGRNGTGDVLDVYTTVFSFGVNNLQPRAADDRVSSAGTGTVIAVLADNGAGPDRDPDGDPLTVAKVTQPLGGTASQIGNDVVYSPDVFELQNGPSFFIGTDFFEYTVTDGEARSAAKVLVDVEGRAGSDEFVLSLVDTRKNSVIDQIGDGERLRLGGKAAVDLGLTVDVAPDAEFLNAADIGSVRLTLDDGVARRVENLAPYSLFGDFGTRFLQGAGVSEGAHRLQVEAFSGRNATGDLFANAFFDFALDVA